ncbi:MAG: alpha-L-fucosidase [Rikenellaceae bacterium]
MKKTLLLTALMAVALPTMAAQKAPKFEKSIESLKQYECPEWFRDAKFGIWAHWGPQSVPMQGDWYARAMYEQHYSNKNKAHVYGYHLENYGHPSEFGFKDIIPLWKAEKFDPEALMKLYKAAGAKYFVSIATHHDNFDLWDSKFTRWDAVEMGPERDIVGDWQAAAKKEGLYFGVSEHLSAGYSWWQASKKSDVDGEYAGKPYDGVNPRNWDLYYDTTTTKYNPWTTENGMFAQLWLARMTDLLESYKPDLVYSDGALPFGPYGEQMLAEFYNGNIEKNRGSLEAVYLAKPARHAKGWALFDPEICVEDRERGSLTAIGERPWQTDTSIGDWFYNKRYVNPDTGTMYRSPYWVLTTLVDVVSKNGNMLLNVIQRPDGTIDQEVVELLGELAQWMEINGESIFSTRPWRVFGEGVQQREGKSDWAEDFHYTAQDIRYTRDKRDRVLYATVMAMPEGDITMREVAAVGREIKSVTLLGSKQKIEWEMNGAGLLIKSPDTSSSKILPVFKITWK